MFTSPTGSPSKGAAQKRHREPTGSTGPENGNVSVNGSGGAAGTSPWRPEPLPRAPEEDQAPDFPDGAFAPDGFAVAASYGGEPSVAQAGHPVPPRVDTAFPLPNPPQPLPAATAAIAGQCVATAAAAPDTLAAARPPHGGSARAGPAAMGPLLRNSSAADGAGSTGSRASSCTAASDPTASEDGREEEAHVAAASLTSSSASSSEDDESDTNEFCERGMREDRVKRYPRFTAEYVAKCKGDLVPFLRELFVPIPAANQPPIHRDPMADRTALHPQAPESHLTQCQFASRFVLYGKYIYLRTLGKGTYSKVVLAEELDYSPAVQQQQLADGGNTPSRTDSRGAVAGGSGGGPQVALKIFRDSEVYREACWEEYNILSALCCPVLGSNELHPARAAPAGSPQMLTTVRTAPGNTGLMDYYGSTGRFMTPLDYVPHPLHPAIVYPVMGPSLLHVLRTIKKASKDLAVATKRTSSPSSGSSAVRSASDTTQTCGKHRVWLRGLPFPVFKVALYQILLFLKFTHARGLVHTDLKPENILFETSLALPAPVNVFYKQLDRNGSGGGGAVASPSVETKKSLNDAHKLTSASSKVTRIAGHFPASPSEDNIAWKLPPGTPLQEQPPSRTASHGSPLIHAHTVTVSMPLLNSIRVVDLGAAQFTSSFTHKSHIDGTTPVSYDPIQTSHYRSPETLMGTGWNASADIFSLACMIPELLTGDCLFMPQDTQEHLALMQHIIGPFGASGGGGRPAIERVFTINARTFHHYFDTDKWKLKWPVTEEIFKDYERQRAGNEENGDADDDDQEPPLDPFKLTTREDEAFVFSKPTLREILSDQPLLLDLCLRMLRYNPLDRITAADALNHPFFHTS